MALIARFGPDWFRELGSDADPGSALVTISGAVGAPASTSWPSAPRCSTCWPPPAARPSRCRRCWSAATSAPGSSPSEPSRLRLSREDLRSVGCALGSGVLIALGESSCGLHESARVIDYLADQSAGQCGPCVHGLAAIATRCVRSPTAWPTRGSSSVYCRWTAEIRGRGACHHPDGAARFVESALTCSATSSSITAASAATPGRPDSRSRRCGGCPAPGPQGNQ